MILCARYGWHDIHHFRADIAYRLPKTKSAAAQATADIFCLTIF
jgi:hypothetical protein